MRKIDAVMGKLCIFYELLKHRILFTDMGGACCKYGTHNTDPDFVLVLFQ